MPPGELESTGIEVVDCIPPAVVCDEFCVVEVETGSVLGGIVVTVLGDLGVETVAGVVVLVEEF